MANDNWVIESGTLLKYTGDATFVSTPPEIRIIGQNAFKNCDNLEKIEFSKGIIEIQRDAFSGCTSLTAVVAPDSTLYIEENAFNLTESPRLLFLCSDNTVASQYADEHNIPRRMFSKEIIKRLQEASKERQQLSVKTFMIASQEIVCSNDMVKRAEVHAFYEALATSFYEAFKQNIPSNAMEENPYNHVSEDTENLLNMVIQFLERQGVYASVAQFSNIMLPVYQKILTIVQNVYAYRMQLAGAVDAYLDSASTRLMNEAESRVTGLGYGIITSSSLVLAAYALDDFITKQRQRKKALEEAQSRMPSYMAHAAIEIVTLYDAYRDEQVLPELRKAIEQLVRLLEKTTVQLLLKHGLLLPNAIPTNNQKSMQILQESSNMDMERLALSLKLDPINTRAYRAAVKGDLVTKELAEMMLFTGLQDTRVMHQVLASSAMTHQILSEIYENISEYESASAQLCKNILEQKTDAITPFAQQSSSAQINKTREEQRELARHLQSQLEEYGEKEYSDAYCLVFPYCEQLQPEQIRGLLRTATAAAADHIKMMVDAVTFTQKPTDEEYQVLAERILRDTFDPMCWGLHYLCVMQRVTTTNQVNAKQPMITAVAETLYKEFVYREACALLDHARTEEQFAAARDMFDKLKTIRGGYKDSNQKKIECFTQINQINMRSITPTSSRKETSAGCYIATAVYGSYDCPQVWTLRRFRDSVLASRRWGRCFIRAYYAVSPTLVQWFGKTIWFNKLFRSILDQLIARLSNKGVSEKPYQDP